MPGIGSSGVLGIKKDKGTAREMRAGNISLLDRARNKPFIPLVFISFRIPKWFEGSQRIKMNRRKLILIAVQKGSAQMVFKSL
jgi:hypothetical protein